MVIDPGTQTVRFLQQGQSYESVLCYTARVGLSVHEMYSYCEATDLLSTDSKTATIARYLSFCVLL